MEAAGYQGDPRSAAEALKSEALVVAARVADSFPDDPLSYALLGSAYYNTGQSEAAAGHLRRCLELDSGQVDARQMLARIAYEKGQLEEVLMICEAGHTESRPNAELLTQLGRALMDLGRTDDAVKVLGRAVGLPGAGSETYYLLGQSCLQAGNYSRAKEEFGAAIRLMPDHTQAYFGLYTACTRLGQTAEADKYRARFLELEAVDRRLLTDRNSRDETLSGVSLVRQTVARTFFGAGQIHLRHGQQAAASDLLVKAAQLDEDAPVYRAALEAMYVQGRAEEKGLAVFERLAAEQPRCAWNHYFLGRLNARLNRPEATERAYARVIELAPGWSEGYRALAEFHLRGKVKVTQALAQARKATELEPSGPHYYLLAVACLENQDRPGAVDAIERAVAAEPDNANYRELLRRLKEGP